MVGLRVSTQPVCSHIFSWTQFICWAERKSEIVTFLWQYLSLCLPRYLTCKLGLGTGRNHMGYCMPSLFLSSWLLFLFVFSSPYLEILKGFICNLPFSRYFVVFRFPVGLSTVIIQKRSCIFELQEVTMVSLKPSNCLIILEV